MRTLNNFYQSQEWIIFRRSIIDERGVICSECEKKIIEDRDLHLHHIVELTEANINDNMIALNPDNVRIVCRDCHNKIHNRFGYGYGKRKRKYDKGVYIVYGAPCSGKKTYVKEHMKEGDLVVEMDLLFNALSMQGMYNNPDDLKFNVFGIRDKLIDNIKTRYGKYDTAWIIGGYPRKSERERLRKKLGAELIFIDISKEECIERLKNCKDYRANNINKFKSYIEKWFEEFN